MRDLSVFEIAAVSGGAIDSVEVTAKREQKDDGGSSSAYAINAASSLSFNTGAALRVAGEGSSCYGAIAKLENNPTYTNAVLAASTCGTAITDVINSTDWSGLAKTLGATQMATDEARSGGTIKQQKSN